MDIMSLNITNIPLDISKHSVLESVIAMSVVDSSNVRV